MKLSLLPNSRLLSGIIKTKESLLKTSKIFKQKGKICKNIFFLLTERYGNFGTL